MIPKTAASFGQHIKVLERSKREKPCQRGGNSHSSNFSHRVQVFVLLSDNKEGDVEAVDHKGETTTQVPFIDCPIGGNPQAKNIHTKRVFDCKAIARFNLTKTNRVTKIVLHQC